MKLVRYGKAGKEKPGLIDDDGKLRDLSKVIDDLGPEQLAPKALKKLAGKNAAKLPLVKGRPRMGVPVAGTRQFIAIGLNYADHAAETNSPIPSEPIVFTKAVSSLQGINDDVMLPKGSKKTDWEIELGMIIGTEARYVSKKDALKHVAGFVMANDVSEREYQLERGGSWDKGKGCETFGPIGQWLVTPDEIKDPQKLNLWLSVNGQSRQDGNTNTMIFDCATIVSYVSRHIKLLPGDIIVTGTPPGVGAGIKPKPVFLKAGDVMTLGIEGLGEAKQKVVKFKK